MDALKILPQAFFDAIARVIPGLAAFFQEMGSGMSIDLSRRPISHCATWRSRLESSRTANVFPS
jgi:hypothetical protein